ncbi:MULTISPECIES: alpha/beta fold hydrolase [Vibrio]|uniref:alpha/beta fold hydrolase n=1 Tax=Vibrio TaxID=662 RepID=UPI00097E1C8A|nr:MULTISPECIES: alpha/beta hydrolase [Vibrio]ASG01687.1 alpha/beta hydrolase [Vibrio anguillarum]MBT2949527.1 alpha/beta hydrolase [Vibrio anguillarum]MDE1266157.1 alpha/beta hydrolase [Vibrio aestuarianus]MDE1298309.1 alpha/beta hydrolase [Vibrio aestuarianus]MDE1330460.1 alpha/beta hydrolase [Vibrio aestuarianus]
MKYIREGSGDYLVLVHGALTDSSMWNDHLEYLSTDFEVVLITLRCFDENDVGGFGLNTHAEDVAKLVNELSKDKPVNIVGWSYGADVVLNALVKQDLPVSKVLLYEPGYPGCLQEPYLSAWQLDANKMFGPVFEYFSNGNLEKAVELLIDGSGNKQGYFQNQSKKVRELQLAKSYTLVHQLNQKEKAVIDTDTISGVSAPIILSYGENTRDLFKLVTVKTSEMLNNAELNELLGESHMLPQEKPREFSKFIKSKLSPQG